MAAVGAFVLKRQGAPTQPTEITTLEQAVDAAKSLGFPWTVADFEPVDPIPDDQNAALTAVSIADSITFRKEWYTSVPPFFPKADGDALRKAISLEGSVLDKLKLEIEKPHWYIARDWDLGTILPYPDLGHTRNAARALTSRAVVRAADGDVDGALSDLASCRKLARHMSTEAALFPMFASQGIYQLTNIAAARIAELWNKDATRLESLAKCLNSNPAAFDGESWIRSEIYNGIAQYRNKALYNDLNAKGLITTDGPPPKVDPSRLVRDGLPTDAYSQDVLYAHLYFWVYGFADVWSEDGFVPGWGSKLDKVVKSYRDEGDLVAKAASLLFPDFGQIEFSIQRAKGMEMLTKTLVRAISLRNEKGSFPASLSELGVPSADPVNSSRQLVYKVTSKGFAIYSLGKNGKDDGGPGAKKPDGTPVDDFGVIYPGTHRS